MTLLLFTGCYAQAADEPALPAEIDQGEKLPPAAPDTAVSTDESRDPAPLEPRGTPDETPLPVMKPAPPTEPAVVQLEPREERASFQILGVRIRPGTTRRVAWSASQSFAGMPVSTPVLVAHGTSPGPVLCLTAAIHGDELNGIEIVRQVFFEIQPTELSGTVVGVPIVNLHGFYRGSRYLPDRSDLNRFFPGDANGNAGSRIAHSFFQKVIRHCDLLVDLHTGSFFRTNLVQLRADLKHPDVLEFIKDFGAITVLQSDGEHGTLRRAASEAGIPAVTLEAGEPHRLQQEEVALGVKALKSLLRNRQMIHSYAFWRGPQPVFYESVWVRTSSGGILMSAVALGDRVSLGDTLGTVTDPITNMRTVIESPVAGRILGMAVNQVVMPGFAAYRVGVETVAVENIPDTFDEVSSDQHEEPAPPLGGDGPVEVEERPE
ncbi:MAG: succinylglutamate desuccinylase/aspartoacylase family protein [Pseudomonadota bacterium]|nr:succinylglutamate desuccinylase/aspartoacylase family protein [Pseudomonadota bacterium]